MSGRDITGGCPAAEGGFPTGMAVVAGDGILQQVLAAADGKLSTDIDRRWSCEPADSLTRLEDAVYEEQSLFEDMDTTVLLRPTVSVLVPSELISADDSEAVCAVMDRYDLSEAKECFAEPAEDADGNILLYSMPAGMRGFLERSFPTEKIGHALIPLIRAASAEAGKGDFMWADIQTGRADVAAFRDGHTLLLNSWRFREPEDAAYYLTYAWRVAGMDAASGRMHVSGEAALRSAVVPMLRDHIGYVTMAPALPRAVKDANSAGVPLCAALALDAAGRR